MLTCLLNNTAMGNGLVLITTSEVEGVGLQWYNLFSGHKGFSVGLVMIMFLISAVLYMLLTLYIEKVFPGEYGIPEIWYFPIAGLLTRFKYNDEAYDPLREKGGSETSHTNANFENEPMDKKIGVKIKGLHKRFGNKNAVNGLNLNMYEDQITVLLGNFYLSELNLYNYQQYIFKVTMELEKPPQCRC